MSREPGSTTESIKVTNFRMALDKRHRGMQESSELVSHQDKPPSADEMALVGRHAGPFQLMRFVAHGGMGTVYEAKRIDADERVAVKVLSGGKRLGPTDSHYKRFRTETAALQRVSHPYLVRILDCGKTEEDLPWIAMEFLHGESLRARMDRYAREGTCLPGKEMVRIAQQIARAMVAMHAREIVHRDLKPDNIMLVPNPEVPGDEIVKVVDFGVAKLLDAETAVTTEGVTLGTVTYMAPEQCLGDARIDGRADLYALGVILYEIIDGQPPFHGSYKSVMHQHISARPPRLRARTDDVSAGLVELVEALLAKAPSQRPALPDVIEALESTPVALVRRPSLVHDADGTSTTTLEREVFQLSPTVKHGKEQDKPAGAAVRRRLLGLAATSLMLGCATYIGFSRLYNQTRFGQEVPTLPGMVRLSGGPFQMGSSAEEIDALCVSLPGGCSENDLKQLGREKPARDVQISSFQLDRKEVNNRAFADFLNIVAADLETIEDRDEHYPRFVKERKTGLPFADLHPAAGGIVLLANGTFAPRPGSENLPAVQVTWHGASRYCRHLGKRLPTEAEWEFAARGAERRKYPWGDAAPQCSSVVFGRDDKLGCPEKPLMLEPVGTSSQDVTPDGIRDLGGNAGEWVQDQFILPYYESCGDCVDPVLDPNTPNADDYRIFRGGTFHSFAWQLRGSTRSRWAPTSVMDGVGVRCASR
ncbi:MAG TPA: bifunctional serine/threonine-protein kinase/formylglycine-generating enzyme family protein [Polyangium sp.]|nr:bifunctional serine/threonine-protein kinase/formylglycine-generating enzyme family protein [Polyangium sp.]